MCDRAPRKGILLERKHMDCGMRMVAPTAIDETITYCVFFLRETTTALEREGRRKLALASSVHEVRPLTRHTRCLWKHKFSYRRQR